MEVDNDVDCVNFRFLCQNVFSSNENCVKFLQEKQLIPINKNCEVCGAQTRLRIRGNNSVIFHCRKGANNGHFSKTALENTFFENSKFGMINILIIVYFFSINVVNYNFLVRETSTSTSKTSQKTITKWKSYCKEICFCYVENKSEEKDLLGGEGVVVEVDECQVGKRMFNNGRLLEGVWILAMIEVNVEIDKAKRERRGGKYRLEICPEDSRHAASLIPLIVKNVKPGTIIVTDMWKEYFSLSNSGYNYFTVNHRTNFMDTLKPTNTQRVESSWRALKRSKSIKSEDLASHLMEYLYRREVKMSFEDPFLYFLKAIKTVFPGK